MTSIVALIALSLTAVEVPWGKGESPEEKKALEETVVCSDGKSHYVVVAPHERRLNQLFYGDGQKFVVVRLPAANIPGNSFFEPRYTNPNGNPDFRGANLRVHSTVEVKEGSKSCLLRCGERETELKALEPEQAKNMILKATFAESPQQYLPNALFRDPSGTYYLVERGVRQGQENNFRLWVGPKGKMTLQKMVNVVADSEGQIFSTKGGELRMLADRLQSSFWIAHKKKVALRSIPLEENWSLIFNELGVYRNQRLGTPCDDM